MKDLCINQLKRNSIFATDVSLLLLILYFIEFLILRNYTHLPLSFSFVISVDLCLGVLPTDPALLFICMILLISMGFVLYFNPRNPIESLTDLTKLSDRGRRYPHGSLHPSVSTLDSWRVDKLGHVFRAGTEACLHSVTR